MLRKPKKFPNKRKKLFVKEIIKKAEEYGFDIVDYEKIEKFNGCYHPILSSDKNEEWWHAIIFIRGKSSDYFFSRCKKHKLNKNDWAKYEVESQYE